MSSLKPTGAQGPFGAPLGPGPVVRPQDSKGASQTIPLPLGPGPVIPFNLDDIQGDILLGVPKKVEEYIFLQIVDVEKFRVDLAKLVPFITSTRQVLDDLNAIAKSKQDAASEGRPSPLVPLLGVTLGLSSSGLTKLGKKADFNDGNIFENGMKADIGALGDPIDPKNPKDPKWLPSWKEEIDVVIDIAGDSWHSLAHRWHEVEDIFGIHTFHASAKVTLKIKGNVRPGDKKGHEHFGFNDGISQPAVAGFNAGALPDEPSIDPGIILMGHSGGPTGLPDWTKDGTILAFRHLEQLVPEFDQFLAENPIVLPGLSPQQGSELLGARLMGRWKSGAPIDITPTRDDPALAADPQHRNHFDFSSVSDQSRCPFAAHIRKMNPRSDIGSDVQSREKNIDPHRILRRGIPFGPELTPMEKITHKTHHHRGLAFACYQSSLQNGFHFLQQSWANNTAFPPHRSEPNVKPGFDPIIGQAGNSARQLVGTNPTAEDKQLQLPFDFVVPRGGEYFFIPSISVLRDELAEAAHIEDEDQA